MIHRFRNRSSATPAEEPEPVATRNKAPSNASGVEPYVAAFKDFLPAVTETTPPWINQLRKAAIARFAEIGFPTTRDEEWKYTNIKPLFEVPFKPVFSPAITLSRAEADRLGLHLAGIRLVFVNGTFLPALSHRGELPNAEILSLRSAMSLHGREIERHLGNYVRYDDHAFTALNAAFFQDGAFIGLLEDEISEPIHVLFISSAAECGASTHPRNLILTRPGTKATIVEEYITLGESPCLTNPVTEIIVAGGAEIQHVKIQRECPDCFHFATIEAHLGYGARFTSHSISIGGRIARNDIHAKFTDESGECVLNGLYLGSSSQLVDHHTRVDHAKPHCNSHEFYHGILADQSHGVFNGKIYVHPDAQKTDAKQTNRNLLLSDDAVIDTKPQLEIYADDVKCTHGATVGQLDEESMFYLQSRGLPEEVARMLLIRAFAIDVVNRINVEPIRIALERILSEKFGADGAPDRRDDTFNRTTASDAEANPGSGTARPESRQSF